MSTHAFRAAFQAGYRGVCSAYGGYNFPGEDAFHLCRFHGDPEMNRFRNWLHVDRRRANNRRNFDPGDYRSI
jgi:hypothetical protein